MYRVGQSGQAFYFVMKYLRGQSLSDRLRERGTIPVPELRRVLIETASALGYAARRGVVHRDIKPDNIVFDEENRCIVTDFGIARTASDSKLTSTGMSVGTPRYMSPEQAQAKPLDGRSDIYSLGIVGYECLTGRTPFDGDDALSILLQHVNAEVPRPTLSTDEQWSLYSVIERMLAKDPTQRFESGEELVLALGGDVSSTAEQRQWTASSGGSAADPTVPSRYMGATDAPRPSATLDRALQHTIDVMGPLLRRLRSWASSVVSSMRASGARVRRQRKPRKEPRKTRASANGRRFAGVRQLFANRWLRYALVTAGAVGIAALSVAAYSGRAPAEPPNPSRCPQAAASRGTHADDAAAKSHTFSLRLDPITSVARGSDLRLAYDVCGLERGATFRTRITVVKNQSGFRRMLGRVDPVTVSLDEAAAGPATRRHRTVQFSQMPAGSYALTIVVTDDNGRRRQRELALEVSDRASDH